MYGKQECGKRLKRERTKKKGRYKQGARSSNPCSRKIQWASEWGGNMAITISLTSGATVIKRVTSTKDKRKTNPSRQGERERKGKEEKEGY